MLRYACAKISLYQKLNDELKEFKGDKKYSISIIIENGGKGSNIPTQMAREIFEFIINNDI